MLAKVGRLAILRDLYGEVYVPPAVAAELRAKRDVASQIEVKARGLIPAIGRLLDQLVAEGFWLSEVMRRIVLDAAGE
jgi:predicted nucleic acid-binding protein